MTYTPREGVDARARNGERVTDLQKNGDLWHGQIEDGPSMWRAGGRHCGTIDCIYDLVADWPTAAATAQCCMCGNKNLSTIEGDGGTECELSDGRWVCSSGCYEIAVTLFDPPAEADDLDGWGPWVADGATWVRADKQAAQVEYNSKGVYVRHRFLKPRKLVRETVTLARFLDQRVVVEVEDGKPVPGSLRWEGE